MSPPAGRRFSPLLDISNQGSGHVLPIIVVSPTCFVTYYDPRGTQELFHPVSEAPHRPVTALRWSCPWPHGTSSG